MERILTLINVINEFESKGKGEKTVYNIEEKEGGINGR